MAKKIYVINFFVEQFFFTNFLITFWNYYYVKSPRSEWLTFIFLFHYEFFEKLSASHFWLGMERSLINLLIFGNFFIYFSYILKTERKIVIFWFVFLTRFHVTRQWKFFGELNQQFYTTAISIGNDIFRTVRKFVKENHRVQKNQRINLN